MRQPWLDERQRVSLLEADPDLGDELPPEEFMQARRHCTVGVVKLAPGRTDPWPAVVPSMGDLLGVIVLRGLMLRTLLVEGRQAVELVGPGDLLSPSTPVAEPSVSTQTRWKIVEPAAVALLDRDFYKDVVRYPALLSALLERSARRSHSLLMRLAIAELPRATSRVHLVLWHLADRWGRVAPGGVLLPMRLSRTTLADLVCARRETVSRALTQLASRDIIRPHPRGFLLTGESPAERQVAESVIRITPSRA